MSKFDITKIKTTDQLATALSQNNKKSFYMKPDKPYIQRNQGDIWIQNGKK